AQERISELLLELGNAAEPRTRAAVVSRALATALALADADAAAVVLASSKRRGERLVLHAGSEMPAALPLPPTGSEALKAIAETGTSVALPDLSENPKIASGDACPGVEAGPVLFTPLRRRDS